MRWLCVVDNKESDAVIVYQKEEKGKYVKIPYFSFFESDLLNSCMVKVTRRAVNTGFACFNLLETETVLNKLRSFVPKQGNEKII